MGSRISAEKKNSILIDIAYKATSDLDCVHKIVSKLEEWGIDKPRIPPVYREREEVDPVYVTVDRNFVISTEILLKIGYTTDGYYMDNGFTLLHTAVENKYLNMIVILLNIGADPNQKSSDCHNITPLELAESLGSEIMVRLLKNNYTLHGKEV